MTIRGREWLALQVAWEEALSADVLARLDVRT